MKFFANIIFVGLIVCSALAEEKQIQVNSENWVGQGKISLLQIVSTDGLTEAESAVFKKIILGDAPAFGEARKFSRQAVSEALRTHLNKNVLKNARLSIPKEVTVYGAGEVITNEKISAKIQIEMQQSCSECRFVVSDVKLPVGRNFPINTKWELKFDFGRVRGPFSIPIEIVEPGASKKVYWISGRVTVFRDVPIAIRTLNTGDRIAKEDFKSISKDISFSTDVPPAIEELIGAQIKSGVPAGQPIWRGNLAREKAMSFGEQITIISGSDTWKVTLKGVSRQNAFIGDDVQVMNPDTKKLILGKVIAKGVVEVK